MHPNHGSMRFSWHACIHTSIPCVNAGCVHGLAPRPQVNKLTSVKNQLPYEYYSLPYCQPEKIEHTAENLGEVLRGDRIENRRVRKGGGVGAG